MMKLHTGSLYWESTFTKEDFVKVNRQECMISQ